MNTKKVVTIATATVLSIIVLIMGFSLVQNVFTRAADVQPQDVVVSNVTQNSAKVEWTSGQEAQSVVEYGTSPSSLNFFAPETQKSKNHSVELTLLSPNTSYYFQIRVNDNKFDNGGIPWTFTTKGVETTQPAKVSTPTPRALPSPVPTVKASCTETDCDQIKAKLGKGCTTQEYLKCLRKLTGTPTPTP